MSVDPKLVKFIREARARGFLDEEIILPLKDKGWPDYEIDEAFSAVLSRSRGRARLVIGLDGPVFSALRKRAKKNMLTVEQQVEDTVRRSVVNSKSGSRTPEKLDDLLVSVFSRKRR